MRLVPSLAALAVCFAVNLPALADSHPKAPAVSPPDPELLEFLVDWQDADGRWVDPLTFAQIDPAAVAAKDARLHNKLPAASTRGQPTQGGADNGRRAR